MNLKKKNEKRCHRKEITKDHIAIRELRLELNMSLKEAGERVGLSSKSIGAIENGRVLLSKKSIKRQSFVATQGLLLGILKMAE